MQLGTLFAEVDELKPSQYDDTVKLKWLNEVETRIVREIIETHEPDTALAELDFVGYTNDTPLETELIAKEPYATLYKYYLFSMIDLTNEESDRYQNDAILFNQAYQDFANYWNRTHKSIYSCRFKH